MMYGDPQHHQQQQQQQPGGEFLRGPPPPPQMMRQPSASSTTLNPSDYHHPSAPGPAPPPPYDAHGDNFGAKRMRKLTQRRAVDYTSTVVRYMQIRMWQRDSRDRTSLQATPAAAIDEKIDARNKLETYIHNMRSTISDNDKLADKIGSDDKEKIESTLKEALEWLNDNQNAEKDDYEQKLKEVEAVCNPVIKQ